jgi:hypothetical protein
MRRGYPVCPTTTVRCHLALATAIRHNQRTSIANPGRGAAFVARASGYAPLLRRGWMTSPNVAPDASTMRLQHFWTIAVGRFLVPPHPAAQSLKP